MGLVCRFGLDLIERCTEDTARPQSNRIYLNLPMQIQSWTLQPKHQQAVATEQGNYSIWQRTRQKQRTSLSRILF